jgi:hypothetical protein
MLDIRKMFANRIVTDGSSVSFVFSRKAKPLDQGVELELTDFTLQEVNAIFNPCAVDPGRTNAFAAAYGFGDNSHTVVKYTTKEARIFTCLDLACGYWKIPVKEEDRHKIAITTRFGIFQFLVMTLGLKNAPTVFQSTMNKVLGKLRWKCTIAYLDNIIIFSPTFEQHLKDLQDVFNDLREANLLAKRSKCHFAKSEVKYLGFLATSTGIKADPDKTSAVTKFPFQQTSKALNPS